MELAAALSEHRVIRRIQDERMLEHVASWRTPVGKYELRGDQRVERVIQLVPVEGRDPCEQIVGELAPDGGCGLGHLLYGAQAIEARH